jgi:hypothetical protein
MLPAEVPMPRGFALVLAFGLVACGEIGQKRAVETAKIKNDTDLLGDASAAVNEMLRAQPECDAVRRHMIVAKQKVEAAAGHIATPVGQTTLDSLRAQIRGAEQSCPAPAE